MSAPAESKRNQLCDRADAEFREHLDDLRAGRVTEAQFWKLVNDLIASLLVGPKPAVYAGGHRHWASDAELMGPVFIRIQRALERMLARGDAPRSLVGVAATAAVRGAQDELRRVDALREVPMGTAAGDWPNMAPRGRGETRWIAHSLMTETVNVEVTDDLDDLDLDDLDTPSVRLHAEMLGMKLLPDLSRDAVRLLADTVNDRFNGDWRAVASACRNGTLGPLQRIFEVLTGDARDVDRLITSIDETRVTPLAEALPIWLHSLSCDLPESGRVWLDLRLDELLGTPSGDLPPMVQARGEALSVQAQSVLDGEAPLAGFRPLRPWLGTADLDDLTTVLRLFAALPRAVSTDSPETVASWWVARVFASASRPLNGVPQGRLKALAQRPKHRSR